MTEKTQAQIDGQIRRLAEKQGLVARKESKLITDNATTAIWFFAENNILESPEAGLNDDEALDWLKQK